MALSLGRWWCPLVQMVGAFGGCPLFWSCAPSFCLLSCFVLGALSLNMALFRVLRAFIWVYRLLVWVCSSWVLCVACGAFVCVRCLAVLRLVACLPLFLSLCLPFSCFMLLLCSLFSSFLLVVLPCLFSCPGGFLWAFVGVVGFFSLSVAQGKKKGRQGLSLASSLVLLRVLC